MLFCSVNIHPLNNPYKTWLPMLYMSGYLNKLGFSRMLFAGISTMPKMSKMS